MNKKLLLSLGTIAAAISPIVAVVACGDDPNPDPKSPNTPPQNPGDPNTPPQNPGDPNNPGHNNSS